MVVFSNTQDPGLAFARNVAKAVSYSAKPNFSWTLPEEFASISEEER